MAKKRLNLMWGEKYEDRNGDEKTAWKRAGTVFVDEDTGAISMKIDCIPVGRRWNGWLQAFEPKEWDKGGDTDGGEPKSANDRLQEDDKPIDLSEIPF